MRSPISPEPVPPSARAEVEDLQAYSAPLEGRRGMLRLDFNENTVGPSPKVVEAIRAIPLEHYAVYPEYDALMDALLPALQGDLGPGRLERSNLGLFNGADAAIHAVCQAYGGPGDRLLITAPSFGYYTPCARMQGMTVVAIPHRMPGLVFPRQAFEEALPEARIAMLCNPNNPTGTRLAPELVWALAQRSPHTLLVVDELYEAFTGDSVLPLVLSRREGFSACPNLVVLRSFSKTAGLAGLRLGHALGHASVIDRLERVTGPYDVNAFAVQAALAVLRDPGFIEAYVDQVHRARTWLLEQLGAAGVRHHAAGGNYLLLWPQQPADRVEARLRQQGVLVRSMAGKTLIDGSLRVSIGTPEQMARFWQAYREADR
ncbi:histidinol-phosphate aminotransferase family protein [Synechococcus sp. RSCCF101]|uniref:pyridoxal phosphate-dependent aminotransferase n=1 Tax=Synechococcus sp. RSCCF101 TaxID=2511069 RepID=UPI0012469674|nr:histidinol-phosphate transaminase [Synechococcus sp. RSCCF101]QEY32831.1 histidinol-phosphate aminotransferase family protein [Synechococcus sp. RSCCF101]